MDHVLGLKCVLCGKQYSVEETLYTCPQCGAEGILDVIYDYDLIGQTLTKESLAKNPDLSIWRYADLLPISNRDLIPPLHVGWTPLYHAKRLGQTLDMKHLYVKDDGRNPSASFKDRASAVGVVKARELGFPGDSPSRQGSTAPHLRRHRALGQRDLRRGL